METRRRPWPYLALAAVVLVLIGWLTARALAKRERIRGLSSNDMSVRVASARWLLEREKLADSLSAQPIIRRSKTAEALGAIALEEGNSALGEQSLGVLGMLLADSEESPRLWARRALALQGMRAMPVLRTAVASGGGTRDEAITALKYIWHPDEDTYRDGVPAQLRLLLSDRSAYKGAAAALSELGDVGAQALIRGCYGPDKKLRSSALSNLGLQRIQAGVDAALFNLQPLKVSRKGDAITALGLIGDPSTAPALVPFLTDADNRVVAVTSLGQIGDPVGIEPIIATLTETDTEYRTAAILALQRIGQPAFSGLVRELHSPELAMRQGAAASLVGSSSPQVTEALISALHDPDAKARASAAMALGWPDNLRGVTPLMAALSDSDWRVVDAAVEALGAIGPSCIQQLLAAVADPNETLTRRYQLARSVAAMGPDPSAVAQLVSGLSSPEPEVQKWSAVALGQIGGDKAVEALQRLQETATGDLQWVVQEQLRQLHVDS